MLSDSQCSVQMQADASEKQLAGVRLSTSFGSLRRQKTRLKCMKYDVIRPESAVGGDAAPPKVI